MASPSVTYSFSPSSTIASSQVNQNFTDLINALTDATKSLSIDGLTVAGAALFKGNVTLGDATSDTVTYVSRVSSSIDPSVTNTYDCGDASYVWANVYATNLYGTLATAAQANVTSLGTLTSLTVTGNVTVDTNTLFVDATNNGIGLGTTSIQGKLHLHAPASSTMLAGPNIVATVDTDTYPVFATLFSGHDNIEMFFDAYYASGQYKSSDAGSNFRIRKNSDLLAIEATGLVAAGSQIVSWQPAIYVDYAGQVGINTSTMLGDFNVKGTSVIHDTTATTGQNLVFVTQNSSQNYFMGINDAGYLCIGTAGTGAVVGSLVNYIRVDSGGRLAIGTSDTTSAKMTVQCASGASAGFLVKNEDGESIIQIGQDATKGSQIICRADGGSDITLWVKPDSFVWNERGADADFRIESDTVEYAFFVDGETGYIGINESEPDTAMHISNAAGACVLTIDSAAANGSSIAFNKAGVPSWLLGTVNADNAIGFYYSGSYRMYIDSSGNVGIGTSSPNNKLDIAGNLTIQNYTNANGQILFYGTSNGYYNYFAGVNAANQYSIGLAGVDVTPEDNSRSELLTIDYTGNVGIGTSPSYKLDVYSASGNIVSRLESGSLASGQSSAFLSKGTGNSAARESVFGTYYRDSSAYGGTDAPCGFMAIAQPDGGYNTLWVDNDNLLCTYPNAYTRVGNDAGQDGAIAVGDQSSDERVKRNIRAIPYGLDEVNKLVPIQYEKQRSDTTCLGFGAQTTKPVLPETIIQTDCHIDDSGVGRMYMSYIQIIPVLTKAIQELSAKLDEANARISQLENK